MLDSLLKTLAELKMSVPLAGFFGGVVYVACTRNLTKAQMFTSISIGVLFASYVTPIAVGYLSKVTRMEFTQEMNSGVAFIMGIVALYLLPALIRKINSYQKVVK